MIGMHIHRFAGAVRLFELQVYYVIHSDKRVKGWLSWYH